jgi:hypothetical protein
MRGFPAHGTWIGFWLFGLSALIASEAGSTGGSKDTNSSHAAILKCGPNSLFVFLRLSGHSKITMPELEELPMSSKGTSLLTLRDAAKRFQIDAEIRCYDPEQVGSVPLPAIGQFRNLESSITPHHFNVIYKVDPQYVYFIDGTTGSKDLIRRSELSRIWTGYAMIEKQVNFPLVPLKWPLVLWVACVTLVAFPAFVLAVRRTRRRNGPTLGSDSQMVL